MVYVNFTQNKIRVTKPRGHHQLSGAMHWSKLHQYNPMKLCKTNTYNTQKHSCDSGQQAINHLCRDAIFVHCMAYMLHDREVSFRQRSMWHWSHIINRRYTDCSQSIHGIYRSSVIGKISRHIPSAYCTVRRHAVWPWYWHLANCRGPGNQTSYHRLPPQILWIEHLRTHLSNWLWNGDESLRLKTLYTVDKSTTDSNSAEDRVHCVTCPRVRSKQLFSIMSVCHFWFWQKFH